MALASADAAYELKTERRTDAVTAWRMGSQASLMEIRRAIITEHDARFKGKHWFAREWCASPGIGNTLPRGILTSAETDNRGRPITLDLSSLPAEFAGIVSPLVMFVPASIDELLNDGRGELRITPRIASLKVSPRAPKRSGWCALERDCTFERTEGEKLKQMREEEPERVCYVWINEEASIGPAIVYADAGGQGIGAGYYPPDFNARVVRKVPVGK